MKCMYCGFENPEMSKFCGKCGKNIGGEKTSEKQKEKGKPSYKKLLIVVGVLVILLLGYWVIAPKITSSPENREPAPLPTSPAPMTTKTSESSTPTATSTSLASRTSPTPTQMVSTSKSIILEPVDKESGYVSYLSSISNYYVGLDYEVGNDGLGVRETFLSFNIAGIPINATITNATLDFSDYRRGGDPFSHFGCNGAYAQDYGAPDAEDFFKGTPRGAIAKWCSEEELSSPSPSNDLISALQGKLGAKRFQIRMQFDEVTGKEDNYIYLNTPKFIVIYTVP